MPIDLTQARLHVYRRFADDAAAATPAELAGVFGVAETEALAALRALDDAHLVVLDRARTRIVMAHPWSADPIGFTVSSPAQKWWGGCAWDSFAIPALTGQDCLVATHCPACGRPLALDVAPGEPPGPDVGPLVAHEGQAWALLAKYADGSDEEYKVPSVETPQVPERLTTQWFATAGTFPDMPVGGTAVQKFTLDRKLPPSGGTVELWIVGHDERGGTGMAHRTFVMQ